MLLRRQGIRQEETFLSGRQDEVSVTDKAGSPEDNARLRHEILHKEIELLRARLDIVRAQVGAVAKSGGTWIHASARSQLGAYPWAKFAALTAASYVVTRSLRKLPLGSIAAAAIPMATVALKRRLR
ncbi:hypothetical protein LJR098_002513 [Rhizobium sp. LjRoot98]|uniref:hypothetical protein n=1 Tax=Rhizobium sp. LjRoot98 TaxID=3342345 RepID=UPI0007128838|nr:hypothetical protein ASC96_29260 [Rhizobium sp. Root1204]